jgi:hypothetical protein
MDAMTPIATVQVVLDEQTEPGVIKVLLDLLEARALGSKWSVPLDTDGAVLDRLAFGMHRRRSRAASTSRTRPVLTQKRGCRC